MEPAVRKTLLTILILVTGSGFAVALGGSTPVTAYQSPGIAIDFGYREVVWVNVNLNYYGDPLNALAYACNEEGFNLSIEGETVTEIRGTANSEIGEWRLWVVEVGSLEWKIVELPYPNIKGYSVVAWAYCDEGEKPTVGVDQYGRSIYGYPQARRVVSLSPSLTEMVGALNAENTLVGTDAYSNYPWKVVESQEKGDISIVGGYTNPSFEAIMKTDPDVVFCDGSQYSHYEMAERIRKSSVNAIVLYAGQSTETIRDNIFIMGTVMGYEMRALNVLDELWEAESEIVKRIGDGNHSPSRVMVALSPEKSPWVSGSHTYFDDVLVRLMGDNVFSGKYDWAQVNSESIPDANPNTIIVIAEQYQANETEYGLMLDRLSKEWKSTDAYKNGRVYMFTDGLGEMAQRPGPRYAQLMEILSLAFCDSPDIPMFIGNDYTNYLKVTKYMGYD